MKDKKEKINGFDVIKIISSRKWRILQAYMCFRKSSVSRVVVTGHESSCEGQTTLHYACKFQAPLYIVKALYQALPQAVHHIDGRKNYPLHIACAYGCSPSVIKFLIDQNQVAAGKMDEKHRNPFLLACKSYVLKSRERSRVANEQLFEVMQLLFDVAPMCPIERDSYGKTPLDYVIERESGLLPVKYAQWLTVRFEREKDKNIYNMLHLNKHLDFNELSKKKNYVLPQNMPEISAPILKENTRRSSIRSMNGLGSSHHSRISI